MTELPRFQEIQYAFTAHIRDPGRFPPPPDVEERRMRIYRELLFNNVSQLLAGTFPVLHKVLGDEKWEALIRDYFATHKAHTPLFPEMPRELLDYLEHERGARPEDPPFLRELAHYEWVELALSIEREEPDLAGVDRDGDLLAGVPVLSPLAWPLAYDFPVHRISPEFQPDQPGEVPTFLVVYRDLRDEVGFLEINAVTARLLDLLGEPDAGRSGAETLALIAQEIGHPDPDAVIRGGTDILASLRARDIVLGVRRTG
ncbi:MAG TPA: putative DNA-binding domain-containing protein [Gammaproteobacteria bacterium]|nr:putative DNA-binding domain-containing protein [Gammaproteobacteria bacterium]